MAQKKLKLLKVENQILDLFPLSSVFHQIPGLEKYDMLPLRPKYTDLKLG